MAAVASFHDTAAWNPLLIEKNVVSAPLGTTSLAKLNRNRQPSAEGIKRASTAPTPGALQPKSSSTTIDALVDLFLVPFGETAPPAKKKMKLVKEKPHAPGSPVVPPEPLFTPDSSPKRKAVRRPPPPGAGPLEPSSPSFSSPESTSGPFVFPGLEQSPPGPPAPPPPTPVVRKKKVHFNENVEVFLIPHRTECRRYYLLGDSRKPSYIGHLQPEFAYRRRPRRQRRRQGGDTEDESSGDESSSEDEGDGRRRGRNVPVPSPGHAFTAVAVPGPTAPVTAPRSILKRTSTQPAPAPSSTAVSSPIAIPAASSAPVYTSSSSSTSPPMIPTASPPQARGKGRMTPRARRGGMTASSSGSSRSTSQQPTWATANAAPSSREQTPESMPIVIKTPTKANSTHTAPATAKASPRSASPSPSATTPALSTSPPKSAKRTHTHPPAPKANNLSSSPPRTRTKSPAKKPPVSIVTATLPAEPPSPSPTHTTFSTTPIGTKVTIKVTRRRSKEGLGKSSDQV